MALMNLTTKVQVVRYHDLARAVSAMAFRGRDPGHAVAPRDALSQRGPWPRNITMYINIYTMYQVIHRTSYLTRTFASTFYTGVALSTPKGLMF